LSPDVAYSCRRPAIGPARRREARQQRDGSQHRGRSNNRQRIVRADTVEERFQHTRPDEGAQYSDRGACQYEPRRASDHRQRNIAAQGAESYAQSNFAPSSGYRVGITPPSPSVAIPSVTHPNPATSAIIPRGIAVARSTDSFMVRTTSVLAE